MVPGTAARSSADSLSALPPDFAFGFEDLRLVLEPALQLVEDFAALSAADSASDWFAAALCMDEASVALKLEGHDDGSPSVAETTGAAAGMRMAFTCIGAPRDRLHSTRQ
ncbi:MAG: hypothetical protein LAO30_02820 [Acidobacteriia bacterium]|nr:hypothetical protein [Terriglobia bacterium]